MQSIIRGLASILTDISTKQWPTPLSATVGIKLFIRLLHVGPCWPSMHPNISLERAQGPAFPMMGVETLCGIDSAVHDG